MTTPRSLILSIAKLCALLGFLWGVGSATAYVATHKYVLEFQAGEASPLTERLVAVAQRGALEGMGFGLLGLGLAIVGWAIGSLRGRLRRAEIVNSATQNALTGILLATAAFVAWASFGTWLAGEFLPFLSSKELWLLNLTGFGGLLAAFVMLDIVVGALPFATKTSPAALTLATLASFGIAAWIAISSVQGTGGGWKSPIRLALVAAILLTSLPVAAYTSRFFVEFFEWLLGDFLVKRWIPRSVTMGLTLALMASMGIGFAALASDSGSTGNQYATLTGSGLPAGPNVILITIDTLRADHLGCYGYRRPTSPFIDSLAAEGARFDDPVAPAAWTKPSTATILTGLYPSRHGALYHGSELHTPEGCSTLAEAFRGAGYVTGGFVSNPNVKKIFKFDRGFQEFFDSPVEDTVTMSTLRNSSFGRVLTSITRRQFNWKYENDIREINSHAIPWIEANHKNKFFLYLHYIDPHEPYSPPSSYQADFAQNHGLVLHNERKKLVGTDLYDGEIRYTDDNLKELVDRLKKLGVWENTLLVITSDHGEEFYEHGVLGHGYSLYQEVVRVPLIFHGPGVDKGKIVKAPVAIVDLDATILDIAGFGKTAFNDGKSFRTSFAAPDWKHGGDFYLENEFGEDDTDLRSFVLTAIRSGELKLILNEQNAYRPPDNPKYGQYELYDLGADPRESKNLFHDVKNIADLDTRVGSMLDNMRAHAEFLVKTGFRSIKPAALSPEIEAGLRAVGYLQGKK